VKVVANRIKNRSGKVAVPAPFLSIQVREPVGNALERFEMSVEKPNILIIMVDQLNGTFFPDGPADFLHAPNLKALAARSARFVNNYTSSPLCAPARASMMAGQLPSRTRVYDNAAEYASSIPTYAHHLRSVELLHLPLG
jgi:hypothetical protein